MVERKNKQGGRRRSHMTHEQEAEILKEFIENAQIGGVLIVTDIKLAYEKVICKTICKTTVYNTIHGHNWRKIVPDERHPKSDVEAQATLKKTS